MGKSKNKTCFLYGLSSISAGLVVGICLTYTIVKETFIKDLKTPNPISIEVIHDTLFDNIDTKRIEYLLKKLSEKCNDCDLEDREDNTMFVYKLWSQLGLNTSFANYSVLTSHQISKKSNYIFKFDKNGRLLNKLEAGHPLAFSPLSQKSLNGTPIYVNFGSVMDFNQISNMNVSVRAHIVMVRLSSIPPEDILRLAIDRGASAIIFFKDSYLEDLENLDDQNYPTGNEYRLISEEGDPQTPFYPSIENIYRLPINETNISRIPVLSISYENALYILNGLKGEYTPSQWMIHLNNTHIGPEYEDESYISLEINTELKETTIRNVIGVIEGCTEPDRYVVVGSGGDTIRGTTALIALSEAFSKTMKSEKWCPYRTIIFCSWAPQQYRTLGLTEWMEENQFLLANRAVAYMSVDLKIDGNFTFMANSVPILYETITNSINTVKNPNLKEVNNSGTKTIYDSYYSHRESPLFGDPDIGFGFVSSPFLQILGIPVLEYFYDCNRRKQDNCEAHHHLIYNPMDPDFNLSKTLLFCYAETLRFLSDRPILPLSEALLYGYYHLDYVLDDLVGPLSSLNLDLDYIQLSMSQFKEALDYFKNIITHTDEQNELLLRKINDILMRLERTYIDNEGIPYSKQYRHIFYAPEQYNSNIGELFPGLKRLMWSYSVESDQLIKEKIVDQMKKHISIITFHLNSAIHLLRQQFEQ